MDVDFNDSRFGGLLRFFFWQDGRASIVSWMLMSAYPTPAYMASVSRRSPALVIPVFASQDLWWDAEILSYLSFYLAIQHCTENTVCKPFSFYLAQNCLDTCWMKWNQKWCMLFSRNSPGISPCSSDSLSTIL